MKFLLLLIVLIVLGSVVAEMSCEKPDDWDDELDGVFDCAYHINDRVFTIPDIAGTANIINSEPTVVSYTIASNTDWCDLGFGCYDEFGTFLGSNTKCEDVKCSESCDCYGVHPVFSSIDAVQDYKLEVLRKSLEELQGRVSKIESKIPTAPVYPVDSHTLG